MEVYNLLIIFLLLCTLLSKYKRLTVFLLSLISVSLIYIAANRGLSVGTDTLPYYWDFMNVDTEKYFHVFSGTQKGWYYVNLFFRDYLDYDLFLYFCYTIIIVGISVYVYKQSKLPIFSMLLFFLLYFYCSSLNIMRQYIALSILLVGFLYMEKNKYIYIASICLATLFHSTAVIGLSFFLLKYIRLNKWFWVLGLISLTFVLGFVFSHILNNILYAFQLLLGESFRYFIYMDNYGGDRNILTNLAINIFFMITYVLSKDRSNILMKMYFLFVIFNNLFGAAGQGNRIFLYFQIAMITCLPNVYYHLSNKLVKYVYGFAALVYSFGIWYFSISDNISDVLPYTFR